MSQSIVTTLSPEELADLLAPRLAERLAAEWALRVRRETGRRRTASRPRHDDQVPTGSEPRTTGGARR
jgi:hypothetical protein